VNILLQDLIAMDAIRAGRTRAEIKQEWTADLETFKSRRGELFALPLIRFCQRSRHACPVASGRLMPTNGA